MIQNDFLGFLIPLLASIWSQRMTAYSSEVRFQNSLKFSQKEAQNKLKLLWSRFFEFRPQTQNMTFSRSREKFPEKKVLRFFRK
jgi:hypothetical protein